MRLRRASGTARRSRAAYAGGLLIAAGMLGMLITFPFIYGDPDASHPATDPGWFRPVGLVIILTIIAGLGLLASSLVVTWLGNRRNEGRDL